MPISPTRVLLVSLGLGLLGALFGAVLGALTLLVELARGLSGDWQVSLIFGAGFGAVVGAVLVPLVAWVFLRRVALSRAIGQTAGGVVAGVALGGLVAPRFCVPLGLLGFVAAGARLWFTTPTRDKHRESAI